MLCRYLPKLFSQLKRQVLWLLDAAKAQIVDSHGLHEGLAHVQGDAKVALESIEALRQYVEVAEDLTAEKMQEIEKQLSAAAGWQVQLEGMRSEQGKIGQRLQNVEKMLYEKMMRNEELNHSEAAKRQEKLNDLCIASEHVVLSVPPRQLGQGGYGSVFEGTWNRTRIVAVKKVKTVGRDGLSPQQVRGVENEALLMVYIRHPNVLNVYGLVRPHGELWMVLELAPYGALSLLVYDTERFAVLPLPLVLAWLCDLLSALEAMHAKGIKHRDVKAENLLVFHQLQVKLCDFGLAKQHDSAGAVSSSASGTGPFMAPEVRNGQGSVTSSDVFSAILAFVQIASRALPQLDDVARQVKVSVERLFSQQPQAELSVDVAARLKQRLLTLLQKGVRYEAGVHPNALRPTAAWLQVELSELLRELGDDPRGLIIRRAPSAEVKAILQTLEQEASLVNKSNEARHRLKGPSSSQSTLPPYPPTQSTSSAAQAATADYASSIEAKIASLIATDYGMEHLLTEEEVQAELQLKKSQLETATQSGNKPKAVLNALRGKVEELESLLADIDLLKKEYEKEQRMRRAVRELIVDQYGLEGVETEEDVAQRLQQLRAKVEEAKAQSKSSKVIDRLELDKKMLEELLKDIEALKVDQSVQGKDGKSKVEVRTHSTTVTAIPALITSMYAVNTGCRESTKRCHVAISCRNIRPLPSSSMRQ